MKTLVEYISESQESLVFEKMNGDTVIQYQDQLGFKRELNKDLGFSKNYNPKAKSEKTRLDQLKHVVCIQFDDVSIYWGGPGEMNGRNIPGVKLGKSTYNQIKDAVVKVYKDMQKDLEQYDYEIPDKIKEMW